MTQSVVPIDHHQFVLGAPEADTLTPDTRGSLMETGPEFVTFYTGIAYGPANLELNVYADDPGIDDPERWEVIEESSILIEENLHVMTLGGDVVHAFDATLRDLATDTYKVRGYARGRDISWDMDVSDPVEDYRIDLWSSADAEPIISIKKTDSAWAVQPIEIEEQIDSIAQAVTDREAVRQRWADLFADTPLESERDNLVRHNVLAIEGIQPGLIHSILELPRQEQEALGRWAARRAYEKAQISNIDWIAPALLAMDSHDGLPSPFDRQGEAFNRLLADPSLSDDKTLSALRPGDESSYSRATVAFGALYAAVSRQAHLYFVALANAIETYGRGEFGQLVSDLRSEFRIED